MKNHFLVTILLFPILLFSQNSTDKIVYFDSIGKYASKENYSSSRIIKDYYTEKDLYQIKDYYKSGILKMEGNSKTKEGFSKEGEFVSYYENGKKKRIENYIKSRLNGSFSEWYEDGNPQSIGEYFETENGFSSGIKIYDFWNSKNEHTVKNGLKDGEWTDINKISKYQHIEIYNQGKFVSGKRINSNGIENQYDALETRPLPLKGIADFYKFIGANFIKTKEAVTNKIAGKLIVQFVVEKDGEIVEPKILKSLGYGLDEEAIRAIKSYGNWIPAQQRGIPVRVQYSIPLTITY
jgi:TonB family protein